MKLFAAGLIVSVLIVLGLGQQPAAPKQQQPSTEDQLALVRLRAQVLEAQSQMQAAQQAFEAAQKKLQELQPRFSTLLKSMQAKLPPPAKGKAWQPQDDKEMGVIFVEVDAQQIASEGKDAAAPAIAEKPKPAGEKPPQK